MYKFEVKDMTCSHCVATVEKAVKGVDGTAKVNIDLATHAVHVESDKPATKFGEAIASAGYTGKLQAA